MLKQIVEEHIKSNKVSNDVDIAITYNTKNSEASMIDIAKMLLKTTNASKIALCAKSLNEHLELTKTNKDIIIDETLLCQVRKYINETKNYSISALQRKFCLEYDLAESIIETLKKDE